MKTQQQIFEEVVTPNGGRTLREKVYQAMQLYSDQQNKELRERIAVVLSDSALGVAELKRELDDVKVNHYNQLNDQLVQDIESLRKENEELKEDRRYWGREYTRLRELVTQYLDNSTSDNAYGADVRDRILNELNPKP